MKNRELMQMALTHLEHSIGISDESQKRLSELKKALRDRLAQPEPEPVCDTLPQECWSVRCQLGRVCKNTAPPSRGDV